MLKSILLLLVIFISHNIYASNKTEIVEVTGTENYATFYHDNFGVDYHIRLTKSDKVIYETHVDTIYKKGVSAQPIPVAVYTQHNFPSEYTVIQYGAITKVDIKYEQVQSGFRISIRPGPASNGNHSFWVEWKQDDLDSLTPVGKTPNGLETFAPIISQMSASKNATARNRTFYTIDPEYRNFKLEIKPTLNYEITREAPKVRHDY